MIKKKNVFKIRRKKTWSAGLGTSNSQANLTMNNSLRDVKVMRDFKVQLATEEEEHGKEFETGVEKLLNESMVTIELSNIEDNRDDVDRLEPLNDAKKLLNRLKNEYSDIYDEVF